MFGQAHSGRITKCREEEEREWNEGNKSEPSRGTPSSFGRLLFADLFSRARMGMGFLKMIDGQKGYLCCTWL